MKFSPIPNQVSNYSFEFDFESKFDFHDKYRWMSTYWMSSFVIAASYIVLTFQGQKWMRNRGKYELRTPLFLWNLCLAIFSIVGTFRTAPELIDGFYHFGFRYTLCNNSNIQFPKPCAIWSWFFIISKFPELGDTFFIIARKQRLIFLHWFHHASVLIYCFHAYYVASAHGRWFIVMNYLVHAMMYSYFALKALSFRVPRVVSMFITLSQLFQMAIGCFVSYYAYKYKMEDFTGCDVSIPSIKASFSMYAAYFVLFSLFFGDAYLKKRPESSSQKQHLKSK